MAEREDRAAALEIVIEAQGPVPPYEQLRTQIAALIAGGELEAGAKLPTVRQLALDLGLAANTVARAYRALEADALIATEGRRGTFVTSAARSANVTTELTGLAGDFVTAARRAGLSAPEAVRLVEQAWRTA